MTTHYDISPLERPHFLVAYVGRVDTPLIDERVRQADRKVLIWHHHSAEVWTPLGLPLQVFVTLGVKNGFQVWSVKTKLLEVWLADVGLDVSLLLPTDELLRVRVEERRTFERRHADRSSK